MSTGRGRTAARQQTPGRATRRRAWRFGRLAETLARAALCAKGYRILASRLRTGVGEIDILAARGGILAIVEVKARPTEAMAREAVTESQWRRLRNAALMVQKENPGLAGHQIRFDLFAVAPWRLPRHIENVRMDDQTV